MKRFHIFLVLGVSKILIADLIFQLNDTEDSDRIRYKEVLATIGALGREAPGHCIPLLCNLLEGRLSRLHGQIQRLVQAGTLLIDKVLSDLYEDIHWILLVAGNMIINTTILYIDRF